MDALDLPFSSAIGLRRSDRPELGSLYLDEAPEVRNHLGTIHAAAQFGLAEAASCVFLQTRFAALAPSCVGVVRRADVTYRAPAQGRIYAKASVDEQRLREFEDRIASRGRAFISVGVAVSDATGTVTLSGSIEWFAQKPS
jgi:acyl-coenzyme A thioesterase PaaI-like protein